MFKLRISYALFILGLLLVSCSKPVDFDQAEDAQPEPILELGLVYTNLDTSLFADGVSVTSFVVRDTTRLEIFGEGFYRDNVVRTDLVFEFTNTIEADFEVNFLFLDDNGQQQYGINVPIPPSMGGNPQLVNVNEVFEGQNLNSLIATTQLVMEFTLVNSAGTVITNNTPGNLNFRSRGIVYFELDL